MAFTKTLSWFQIPSQGISLTTQVKIIRSPWVVPFAAFTLWPKRSRQASGGAGEVSNTDLIGGCIYSDKQCPRHPISNLSDFIYSKGKTPVFPLSTIDLVLWRLGQDPRSAGRLLNRWILKWWSGEQRKERLFQRLFLFQWERWGVWTFWSKLTEFCLIANPLVRLMYLLCAFNIYLNQVQIPVDGNCL